MDISDIHMVKLRFICCIFNAGHSLVTAISYLQSHVPVVVVYERCPCRARVQGRFLAHLGFWMIHNNDDLAIVCDQRVSSPSDCHCLADGFAKIVFVTQPPIL